MRRVIRTLWVSVGVAGCVSEPPGNDADAFQAEGPRDAASGVQIDAFEPSWNPGVDAAGDAAPPAPEASLDAAPIALDAAPDAAMVVPDAAPDAFAGGEPDARADAAAVPPDVAPDAAPADLDATPDAAASPPDAAPPLPDLPLACAAHAECPVDTFCVEGACQAGGIPCGEARPCPAGDICRFGFCAPGAAACQDDLGCVAGEICEGGACLPADCLSDDECVMPAVCAEGRCGIPGAAEACNGQDDDGDGAVDEGPGLCPDAQLCRRGACVEPACRDGETRLTDGAGPDQGRLEICLRGTWGTVCLAGFEANAARIACRTAGLPEAAPTFGGAPGGALDHPIWVAGLRCAGDEASLFDCEPAEALGAGCTHGHDVGLSCPAGPPPEVCNGADDDLDGEVDEGELCEAGFLCHAGACLPFGPEACNGQDDDLNGVADDGAPCGAGERCVEGACVLNPETCNGLDDDGNGLVDDEAPCGEGEICRNGLCQPRPCGEGELRLVGGPDANSGRVEICHAEVWGTVCDDAWDAADAQVVCRRLGLPFEGAQSRSNANFGQGVGQIWLDQVACGGGEAGLEQCAHNGWGLHDCTHPEDAGVVCRELAGGACAEGEVRLVDGPSNQAGRVEICHQGVWGTVCDDGWDDQDAAVVCRQLGFNPASPLGLQFSFYGEGGDPIWLDDVGCGGGEANLAACGHSGWGVHNCTHIEDAAVDCSL